MKYWPLVSLFLLMAAIVTSVLMAGCDSGRDSSTDRNAAGSSSARLSFQPSGRSQDLLCLLPRPTDQKLPSWITDAPGGCYCDSSETPSCYHIDIGDDRRRSVILSKGTQLRGPVRIDGARWLRFSLAAKGNPDAALKGYELSEKEANALKGIEREKFDAVASELGERISKAGIGAVPIVDDGDPGFRRSIDRILHDRDIFKAKI